MRAISVLLVALTCMFGLTGCTDDVFSEKNSRSLFEYGKNVVTKEH